MKVWILTAAILMQMCIGATYAWPVLSAEMKSTTCLPQRMLQMPYTFFYFSFPLTMLVSGRIMRWFGPRVSAMTGGALFGAGWLLAGLGSRSFLWTIFGVGLLSGIGAGLAYIVPIATAVKWFPRQKGLVTGLAVAGFGGGAALVSQVAERFYTSGWNAFQPFFALGAAFIILTCLSGFFMRNPPGWQEPLHQRGLKPDRRVILLFLGMFCGLAAGFVVNANLRQLYAGTLLTVGAWGVSQFAIGNALGRIIWGWGFDRGSGTAFILSANLAVQGCVLILAWWLNASVVGFLLFSFAAGFNYGGVLVLYAAAAGRLWGSVERIYGLIFAANIPAALFPLISGILYDQLGHFYLALSFCAGMALIYAALLAPQHACLQPEQAAINTGRVDSG